MALIDSVSASGKYAIPMFLAPNSLNSTFAFDYNSQNAFRYVSRTTDFSQKKSIFHVPRKKNGENNSLPQSILVFVVK